MPQDTRVDELESAIRAVCEPYFDRPLKEISLGMVLMRLFQLLMRLEMFKQQELIKKVMLIVPKVIKMILFQKPVVMHKKYYKMQKLILLKQ